MPSAHIADLSVVHGSGKRNHIIGTTANIDATALPGHCVFDGDRFERSDLNLTLQPSFRILPSDRVFVIGSCFAREIHRALRHRGLCATGVELGNKYNSFSILQTLRWALEDGYDERVLVQQADGKWFDGHRHPFESHASAQEAVAAHQTILAAAAAAVTSCDIIVITLGLVEAWHDDRENVWLNGSPPLKKIKAARDRFSVHRTSHAQNLAALVETFSLLREANPAIRIICSVSPVPLHATFFAEDVLIANMYSKSTLRSAMADAIHSFTQGNAPCVDYFPSYELVMLNPNRHDVWRDRHPTGEPDGRHIQPEFVRDVIIPLFTRTYLGDPRHQTPANSVF